MTEPSYRTDRLFMGGAWVEPNSRDVLQVRSPFSHALIGHAPDANAVDIGRAVEAARHCFDRTAWPDLTIRERAAYLRRAADACEANAERLARVTTDEVGLPFARVAKVMVDRTVRMIRYYADLGEQTEREEVRSGPGYRVTVRREPLGVVGVITPWNAPLPMAHFSIAPALLAGCTVVLKTAAETPLHGQLLAAIYAEIFPPGVLNIVPAGREASEALVRHPGVDKISFTGSTATGRRIGAICGEQLKRVGLELGGKSAAIVLDDVDLAAAMPRLVGAALQNNCQACVGQTRILAPESRYDEILAAFAEGVGRLKLGDPDDPTTTTGPLISEKQLARAEDYVASGLAEGAVLVRGGRRPPFLERGFFLEPAVFRDVENSMRIAREEIFGPVFCVIPYGDEEEAIAIANDSDYGLSGTVWTSNEGRARRVARRVRTGNYGINTFMLEYQAPFGGFKASGIGRQLGPEGLQSFFELKAIHEMVAA